ncbi:MAG: DegT/DnrJ/EryC1/StrS family aminotransferase, partial [Spirochaetales bacterium]|nr:DegT/DnrJ/EryC1/StrS family aminotransferase [Spirochaetales bacterium]
MDKQKENTLFTDPSGRGTDTAFKVSTPGKMQPYSQDEIDAVVEVMKASEGQTQGKYLAKFEKDFEAYTGANHAFGVDNCTNAIRLAAILCRLSAGDEVIIPAYTYCASAIPFGETGAKIVWSDINRDTWTVDPADIERKITSRTRAVVVVHLLGMPADMEAILEISEKHNLRIIEDCAQAPGTSINGRYVGTFGDFGCFSFHTAKNFTTLGEGGILTVRSDKDAALIPGLRNNGVCAYTGDRERYWLPAMSNVDLDIEGEWPNNFCIGEAQCAQGSVSLKSLETINDTLITQAEKIQTQLADTAEISFAKVPEGYRHIYHQFVMHFDGTALGKDRNNLLDILTNEYRIKSIVQYHPLYRYPLFQKLGAGDQDCPV